MPGPPPKPAAQRRRRNKVAGARTLKVAGPVETPALPAGREWHPLTVAWWADVWASPMAPEYDRSDLHGLYVLAALVEQFWQLPSKDLAGEIRLQRQAFGLSPLDRRRLEWEIDRGEGAAESTGKRREARKPRPAKPDPRAAATG